MRCVEAKGQKGSRSCYLDKENECSVCYDLAIAKTLSHFSKKGNCFLNSHLYMEPSIICN